MNKVFARGEQLGFRVERPRRTLIIRAAGKSTEPAGGKQSLELPLMVVGGQVAVTGSAAALALISGVDAAIAVFFGGAVAFLPNAVFALAMAGVGGKLPATVEAAALLGGWVAKLLLTVVLLLLAIAVANLGSAAFFVGLAASLATPLALPVLIEGAQRGRAGRRARRQGDG